jgi:Domain of unknown function (DUF4276)
MKQLRYTLLSDGSSDKALLHVLTWLLRAHQVECAIQPTWADLRRLPKPPKKLSEKIQLTIELYPCDLLFIHRDAERESPEKRVVEIEQALRDISSIVLPPAVCVIPVRMQEAWLLFNEAALRKAAGNPRGRMSLQLPDIYKMEQLPDPKDTLHGLLRQASGLSGRRLQKLSVYELVHRIAELIEDFSPLRNLPAFNVLEVKIQEVIEQQGWQY